MDVLSYSALPGCNANGFGGKGEPFSLWTLWPFSFNVALPSRQKTMTIKLPMASATEGYL